MKSNNILLLEDDKTLAYTIRDILEENDYCVDIVRDGEAAANLSFEKNYDLYIFDINVPQINGIELLKDLRHAGDTTPTIYISALMDLTSITKAFDAGAEDYLKKPFYPEELLLRVNNRLQGKQQTIIEYQSIAYHPDTKEIFKDGKIISLGSVQIKLFDALMQNIGKLTLKEDLLELLEHPSNTALRVAMAKLKQKLEIEITNVRGLGYILENI